MVISKMLQPCSLLPPKERMRGSLFSMGMYTFLRRQFHSPCVPGHGLRYSCSVGTSLHEARPAKLMSPCFFPDRPGYSQYLCTSPIPDTKSSDVRFTSYRVAVLLYGPRLQHSSFELFVCIIAHTLKRPPISGLFDPVCGALMAHPALLGVARYKQSPPRPYVLLLVGTKKLHAQRRRKQ